MNGAPEFDRNAVITIQGGGIYGLSLLGQLYALVSVAKVTPLAVAGNSAGAIIATLYWSGLQPDEILKRFAALADDPGINGHSALVDLFGPPHPINVPEPIDYDAFTRLLDRFSEVRRPELHSLRATLVTLWERLEHHFPTPPDPAATPAPGPAPPPSRGRRVLNATKHVVATPVRWAGRGIRTASGLWRNYSDYGALREFLDEHHDLVRDIRVAGRVLMAKGAFTGERLEQVIDTWIRGSERLKNVTLPPPDQLLTFGDLKDVDLPALFLTATNVTRGRLEVINSFDPRYAHVKIARAVRVSAGFPGVLRPSDIDDDPDGCWYIDGGVISNFPAWIFSRDFRKRMYESDRKFLLAPRPWINIGLRMSGEPAPAEPSQGSPQPALPLGIWEYYVSLFRFASGLARDELERLLMTNIPRLVLVNQSASDTLGPTPDRMWHIHEVTSDKVYAMVYHASQFAREQLQGLRFTLPWGDEAEREILRLLERMAVRAGQILHATDPAVTGFRANIFIPSGDDLVLRYQWNMDGDADRESRFQVRSGHIGRCFMLRLPLLGNLRMVLERAAADDADLFRFYKTHRATYDAIRSVQPARTWLACVPIFDPHDLYQTPQPRTPKPSPHPFYAEAPSFWDGPVLGTLNLDAGFDFRNLNLPEEMSAQLLDERIQSIVALMHVMATEIGTILGPALPSKV